MQANGRSPQEHVETLRREGARLAAMPVDALDAPVPAVEGWTLESVVRHTSRVHRWVAAVLAAGPEAEGRDVGADLPRPPKGAACLEAYQLALDELLHELEQHEPGDAAATFPGTDACDVSFWARRQAHEVSVHRIDAADAVHAAGGPPLAALDAGSAADGVDEWLRLFLASRLLARHGELPAELVGRSIHLHGTDRAGVDEVQTEWTISMQPAAIDVTDAHTKADVALRGPAADLFLVVWRRRGLDAADVVGEAPIAEHLLELCRF